MLQLELVELRVKRKPYRGRYVECPDLRIKKRKKNDLGKEETSLKKDGFNQIKNPIFLLILLTRFVKRAL